MGRSSRQSANNLAEKLKFIREEFRLSQNQMLVKLGLSEEEGLFRSSISGYELGTRIPPFKVLLAYAKLANVYVDVLIDDELEIPEQIPSREKSNGILKIKDSLADQ
jgi:transcriptional regulator with XRE-family HTH domain